MSFFSNLRLARQEKRDNARRAAGETFWTWFLENKAFLESYVENTHAVVSAIGERLAAVNPRLTFEMGQANDGVYEFIVSADGISAVFPAVTDLTKLAPTIDGWRVIAFRPRKPESLGNTVTLEGMDLPTSALWYRSRDHDDRIDITLFVEGSDMDEAQAYLGPIFILLDATLGEYDVATRIGHIEFDDCPAAPGEAGLKPILELAREVDARFGRADA